MFYKLINQSKKSGEKTVCVVYRDSDGKEYLRSTGVKVAPTLFNTKTGKISPKDSDNVEKNEAVSKVTRLFEVIERRVREQGGHNHAWLFKKYVTEQEAFAVEFNRDVAVLRTNFISRADTVRNQITRLEKMLAAKQAELNDLEELTETGESTNKHLFSETLLAYHDYQKNKLIKKGTIQTYRVMGSIVTAFRPNLSIEDINLTLLNEFQQHLIKKGLRNPSTNGILIRLIAFYQHVAEELNIDTNFLKKFNHLKTTKDENIIFLTNAELKAFAELPITTKGQHRTRELFLFACETGLRYSDLLVSRANVKEVTYQNEKGETVNGKLLSVKTKKSGKQVNIPLTETALDILERNNYEFSRPSEAQYNQALRAIGKKVTALHTEIIRTHQSGAETIEKPCFKWEALTSHVARKTFVDKALANNASPMSVAEWLGHSDTKMIEAHYSHKAELAKREAWKIL